VSAWRSAELLSQAALGREALPRLELVAADQFPDVLAQARVDGRSVIGDFHAA